MSESERFGIRIVVRQRENYWLAHIKGRETFCESGLSRTDALGKLLISMNAANEFGIKIETRRSEDENATKDNVTERKEADDREAAL